MKIRISDGRLKIDFGLSEKIVSVKGSFQIPLAHIVKASTVAPRAAWYEARIGTYVPGLIRAGTIYPKRGREFWFVIKNKDILTVELKDEPYRRIVMSVDMNDYWADKINDAAGCTA